MSQDDYIQFVEDALAGGMDPSEAAQALGERYPQLPMAEGAAAIRRLAALSPAAEAVGMDVRADGSPAVAEKTRTRLAATGDPVEDAAYGAWLLLQAFSGAAPAEIGAQVRLGYPALTAVQMARVLIHGPPTPLFPDLQPPSMAVTLMDPAVARPAAPDLASALHAVYPALSGREVARLVIARGAFPATDADGMRAALAAAGFAPAEIVAVVAELFPGPPVTAGPPQLVTFTGTNAVQIPSLAAYNFGSGEDYTVEAWMRAPRQANVGSHENSIIEKWSGDGNAATGYPFSLRIENQNAGAAGRLTSARFDRKGGPALWSGGTFLDDRFHHVAVTSARREMLLYVDGEVQGKASDVTSGPTGNDWPLYLGARGGRQWHDNFTGRLMEVRIWKGARSREQITAAMRRTVDPLEPGLVAYFKLREGTGSVARDSTAAANHGVIADPGWSVVDGYPLMETTIFPAVGGSGAGFDDTAAALAIGTPVSRIRVRAGDVVDAVQVLYGPDERPLSLHGGGGGGMAEVVVDPRDPITGVGGFTGTYHRRKCVLTLSFQSRSGKRYGPFGTGGGADPERSSFLYVAPPGQSLLALSGKADGFLSTLGATMAAIYP